MFELAVLDAVSHFNIGYLATLLFFDKVGINRGYYSTKGCLKHDNTRVTSSKRKSLDTAKDRRRILRGVRKGKGDKTKQLEGTVYGAGKF